MILREDVRLTIGVVVQFMNGHCYLHPDCRCYVCEFARYTMFIRSSLPTVTDEEWYAVSPPTTIEGEDIEILVAYRNQIDAILAERKENQ